MPNFPGVDFPLDSLRCGSPSATTVTILDENGDPHTITVSVDGDLAVDGVPVNIAGTPEIVVEVVRPASPAAGQIMSVQIGPPMVVSVWDGAAWSVFGELVTGGVAAAEIGRRFDRLIEAVEVIDASGDPWSNAKRDPALYPAWWTQPVINTRFGSEVWRVELDPSGAKFWQQVS